MSDTPESHLHEVPPIETDDPLICFCFGVTQQQVVSAIANYNCQTSWDVMQVCKAGNGCSSCWGDIEQLVQMYQSPPGGFAG